MFLVLVPELSSQIPVHSSTACAWCLRLAYAHAAGGQGTSGPWLGVDRRRQPPTASRHPPSHPPAPRPTHTPPRLHDHDHDMPRATGHAPRATSCRAGSCELRGSWPACAAAWCNNCNSVSRVACRDHVAQCAGQKKTGTPVVGMGGKKVTGQKIFWGAFFMVFLNSPRRATPKKTRQLPPKKHRYWMSVGFFVCIR
jgi:hypothetical protein